ncbi:MlaD family protein [Mycobacterium talmoniae]|uniref:Mammalian cell entry protein n=1 Tax=Mycobacterium talmoniae TaxID=1858794 RepID=A0A1S1NKE4_9MYCO|nr:MULTISPECIES: MlaD family protein [Mycobacterium]OHV04958.1 mammalian cell entry protein [Mycobacterium talmoniae]TDH56989.1 MCE family protein [Mycobacterium eburneum]
MKTTRPLLEGPARLLVYAVRALTRHRVAASVTGIVVTLIAVTVYIVGGTLGISPVRSTIAVQVRLRESGGLLANQDVTLRGVRIGRVDSVRFTDTGVVASIEIDSRIRVPRDSLARVSALSAAGEQYLDFQPQQPGGPALTDGTVLDEHRTAVPVSLAQLLADANGMLAQVDPDKLAAITTELRVSNQGPAKLAALLDGGVFLISALDSVLPQTVSVLRTSRTVLTTLVETNSGLMHTSQNLHDILRGTRSMDGGFRSLVDRGQRPLTALDKIIEDNSDTMVQLLGNLATTAQLSSVRLPALNELVNSDRGGSAVEALAGVVRDGAVWVLVDLYPRYSCDYGLPALPPALPNYPEPYLYTYCKNPDPAVLVRGARNAPRPPGDDTAGPPPGYDPKAQTDPAPTDAPTLPTPFGGSPMQVQLPADPPG